MEVDTVADMKVDKVADMDQELVVHPRWPIWR